MLSLEAILESIYSSEAGQKALPPILLCLDPGETTGWAVFKYGKLVDWGQAPTYDKEVKKVNWLEVIDLMNAKVPTHVICENYRVYAHKLERHTFSEIPTIRIIGGFELLCAMNSVVIDYQMAQQAKQFITDDKLKSWGLWKDGMRHSRDAIRHGLYYLIITNKKNIGGNKI